MTEVLLERAREVVDRHPFPVRPPDADISLFIAGHGTGQNAKSRLAIDQEVERIRGLKRFAMVQAVFMEEPPLIPEVYALSITPHAVVVPFFVSEGLHVSEDIPVLLGEPAAKVKQRLAANRPTWRNPTERKDRLVWYGQAVGTHPGMTEVILELVRESARWNSSPPGTARE
jgi:sirohydrochlorin cobaltochelatase